MIDNSTGIEKLMASGSGYERTIASLALRSVLSKVCSLPKPNIVVFDEVFGKISNENLEMVSEFFVKIKDYFEKTNQILTTLNPKETTVYYAAKDIPMNYAVSGTLFSNRELL